MTTIHRIHIGNHHLLYAAVVIFSAGVGLSIVNANFEWLSRFGSLLVVVGTLFYSKHILITPHSMLDIEDNAERKLRHFKKSQLNHKAAIIYAPWIACLGGVTWGFADLLNVPFGW